MRGTRTRSRVRGGMGWTCQASLLLEDRVDPLFGGVRLRLVASGGVPALGGDPDVDRLEPLDVGGRRGRQGHGAALKLRDDAVSLAGRRRVAAQHAKAEG